MSNKRPVNDCTKCGYNWIPRKDNPPSCPKCGSRYWATEEKPKRGRPHRPKKPEAPPVEIPIEEAPEPEVIPEVQRETEEEIPQLV